MVEQVELAAAGSRIVVANGVLDRLRELVPPADAARRAAIITDANVGPLYASRAAAAFDNAITITIPAGEKHKTRETWTRVTDELLTHRVGRDGMIVALGGGVVGDLAGFVAATYLRGVPVVQVPTSLVAMIDASIGGKTGVDVPAGKNLVGAFHPATLIAVDPTVLATLPPRELRGGLAEALKHGVIADAEYFARVEAVRGVPSLDIVARSIAIKAAVVNDDPREAGRRKVLNFGHTLGHAIETFSEYRVIHGEAVAIGMILEARLGETLGVTEPGTASAIVRALASAGLPVSANIDAATIVELTKVDKKVRGGRVEYALPSAIGSFNDWTTPVDDAAVIASLASV